MNGLNISTITFSRWPKCYQFGYRAFEAKQTVNASNMKLKRFQMIKVIKVRRTLTQVILALLLTCASFTNLKAEELSKEDSLFFESKIRPLLINRCYSCHSEGKKVKGHLLLDRKAGWKKGGDGGPTIIPGDPEKSLLIQAVSYQNSELQMPPKSKLPDHEIALLVEWVQRGAPDPRTNLKAKKSEDEFDVQERAQAHWSWKPAVSPKLPAVKNKSWAKDPIDYFILNRLESKKLQPAPEASPRTWIRRVTFDLTGLPPRPEDVKAFVKDPSPEARRNAVKRLLNSPHYGEKWAQHWLDLMRYAETRGHEQDYSMPNAWRYRDYTIRAFNQDVPYNTFVTEHIAGDLIQKPRIDAETKTNQSIQGTGFWQLHDATHSPVDIRGDEAERMANQLDVFSKAFLGLSFGCVRCHAHKFDAIPHEDYYAMYGYLQSSSYQLADVSDPEAQKKAYDFLNLADKRIQAVSRVNQSLLFKNQIARWGEMMSQLLLKTEKTKIPPPQIEFWKKEIEKALKDDAHLLHPLVKIASQTEAETIPKTQKQILDSWKAKTKSTREAFEKQPIAITLEKGERNYVRTERPQKAEDLVIDFDHLGKEDWITAGYKFNSSPQPTGTIIFTEDPQNPIQRIVEEDEAQGNRLTKRFSGFYRTRTFEVTSDTLWYNFKGEAEVFLAVDSHRVVAGPLHGIVKQRIKSPNGFGWHGHNVKDYIGHRVHVEFKPKKDFSLREIRFYQGRPKDIFKANEALRQALGSKTLKSTQETLALFQEVFLKSVTDWPKPKSAHKELAQAQAQILNYFLRVGKQLQTESDSKIRDRWARKMNVFIQSRKKVEKQIPNPIFVLALLDGSGEEEPLHYRGNASTRSDDTVPRGILTALQRPDQPIRHPATGSGRLQLAQELTRAENPLLTRVIVNRVWSHLMGQGIVSTVDDFGAMGFKPTHPQLLDHLAKRFQKEGWSIKQLIQNIVLSSSYGMSSQPNDKALEIDPTNKLYHRMNIRRLTGENIRDSLLYISGRLDKRLFGPSVEVEITPFMRGNRSPRHSGPRDGQGRRSIYVKVRRNHISHFLNTFDKPTPFATIGKRNVSNSSAQSLILMNDPFVHDQAKLWAKNLLTPTEGSKNSKTILIHRAYQEIFSRAPDKEELKACLDFLTEIDGEKGPSLGSEEAWSQLCHALFNFKEFIYIN